VRRAFLLASLFAACITSAFADDRPAVDLVAAFTLGIAPGETLGLFGDGKTQSVMTQSGPGAFAGTPANGTPFTFEVSEAGKCVFDIRFSEAGKFVAGIEVDANKLKSLTYDKTGAHGTVVDYQVNLVGGDGIVQRLGANGEHSSSSSNSHMSTTLAPEAMQAAFAALQSGACPAAQ
jgi:hypothetical protein